MRTWGPPQSSLRRTSYAKSKTPQQK